MVNSRQIIRSVVLALLLLAFSAASASRAFGQFTLSSPSGLQPSAVDPGGTAVATLNLGPPSGFTDTVALTCAVTSNQVGVILPQCAISPTSAVPPAQPALTVTTTGGPPAGLYTITVTGTSGATTETIEMGLSVVSEAENYTLSVLPTTATPSPITAGNPATSVVTVTPIGSYGSSVPHMVTLACLSVTPIVSDGPFCSFTATTGASMLPANTVLISGGAIATATMTITTLGVTPVTSLRHGQVFYALWLLVPGLAVVGAGRRRKNFFAALLLMAVAGGLLLMPACGSSAHTNSPNGEITPKNTYTFTLSAADENGAAPSNVTSGQAVVTLVVN
jgi:hypothetical protein